MEVKNNSVINFTCMDILVFSIEKQTEAEKRRQKQELIQQ